MCCHLNRNGDVAVAKDLHRSAFANRTNRYELVDSDRAALRKQLIELCKVDDLVLDPVGVLEATQLWQPHVQRHLPALEVGRNLVPGFRSFGATTSGLALGSLAAADASLSGPGSWSGTKMMN